MDLKKKILLILSVLGLPVLMQCAKIGTPSGGPRDHTPPVFLGANPANGAVRFKARKAELYFNEHVEVKNAQTQLTISPNLKQVPDFITAPKKLIVLFKDTLREQITYTLSFGESLVDLNEGNPLGSFEYVFSTGDHLDSLSYIGRVLNAFTLDPEMLDEKVSLYFMLYKGSRDSLPLEEQPLYLSRVDDVGLFRITHLAPGEYLPFVLKDANSSLTYDNPEGERVAFSDSLLLLDDRFFKTDTFVTNKKERDSLLFHHAEPFSIDQVFFTFQDYPKNQYLKSYSRPDSIRFSLIFNVPSPEFPKVRVLDSLAPEKWAVIEKSARSDSFHYWIYDPYLYKKRVLPIEVQYLETDSLMQWVNRCDTLNLSMPPPPRQEQASSERRRRNEEPEQEVKKPRVNSLPLLINFVNLIDIEGGFVLEAPLPVDSVDLSRIRLREDTLQTGHPFVLTRDSLSSRRFFLDFERSFEKKYTLMLDSGAFFSPYGVHNDTLQTFQATVRRMADYGAILLDLTGVKVPVLIQVLDDKGERLLRNYRVDRDSLLTIPYLLKGKYVLKAVHDENGNGIWDSGDYLAGIQPERVEFCQVVPEVQESFDTQVPWTLKRTDFDADSYRIIQGVRSPVREEIVKWKAAEEARMRAAQALE